MTYGSFAATVHVPTAGYRWAESIDVPVPTAAIDALEDVLNRTLTGPIERAQVLSDEKGVSARRLNPEERGQDGPWLVENEPFPGNSWGHRYAPLSMSEFGQLLFRFSRAKSPDDYLKVANQYGKLGHGLEFESIHLWEWHTRRVRALMELVSWTKQEAQERLAWVVRWSEGLTVPTIRLGAVVDYLAAVDQKIDYKPTPDGASQITRVVRNGQSETPSDLPWYWRMGERRIIDQDVLYDAAGRARWEVGDVIGPARFFLMDELNRAVKGHVTTKLMPFALGDLFRVYVVPDCLLATIYLQLQIVVGRGIVKFDWKPCEAEGCLNYFRRRGNQRYCSSTCQRWGRSRRNIRYRQDHAPRSS